MALVPLIGPTYDLDSRAADVQRTINLIPVPLEPGNERTKWVFKDVPGLEVFSTEADVSTYDPDYASRLLIANFVSDAVDSSQYETPYAVFGAPTFSNGMGTGSSDYVTWTGSQFTPVTAVTLEVWARYSSLGTLNNEYLNLSRLNVTAGTFAGLGWRYSDGRGMFSASNVSGATPTVAANTPVHLCVYIPAGATPTCRFSVNGADMGTVIYTGRDTFTGVSAGELSNSVLPGYSYTVLATRATEGDYYGSATFTPDTYPFPTAG